MAKQLRWRWQPFSYTQWVVDGWPYVFFLNGCVNDGIKIVCITKRQIKSLSFDVFINYLNEFYCIMSLFVKFDLTFYGIHIPICYIFNHFIHRLPTLLCHLVCMCHCHTQTNKLSKKNIIKMLNVINSGFFDIPNENFIQSLYVHFTYGE